MTEQKELLHQKKADIMITDCGSLNLISQNNVIGSSTIRRGGFIGVAMALLKKCVTGGVGL